MKAAAPAAATKTIMPAAKIKPKKRSNRPPRRRRRLGSVGLTGAVRSIANLIPIADSAARRGAQLLRQPSSRLWQEQAGVLPKSFVRGDALRRKKWLYQ